MVLVCFAAVNLAIAKEINQTQNFVGTWKAVKAKDLTKLPIVEFTKDNKVVMHVVANGKKTLVTVGTFKIEGDKVTFSAKKGDEEDIEINTIKLLTADKLILVDPKGVEEEFEKAKE